MTPAQMALDFNRHFVVRNHWGGAFHVCDEDHITTLYPGQPSFFGSIREARDWAGMHGIEAHLCKQTYVPGAAEKLEPTQPTATLSRA